MDAIDLFELAPPMDPPHAHMSPHNQQHNLHNHNHNNHHHHNLKQYNDDNALRACRPGSSLISAGLAAISANYGEGDNHNNFGPIGGGGGHSQLSPQAGHSGGGSAMPTAGGLMMAPLVAAAFRRPGVIQAPSGGGLMPSGHPPPPIYCSSPSPYSPAAVSSEPCTPSAFFPTAAAAYGCFSPMGLDPMGLAFAWNFIGASDVIGYCSEQNTASGASSDSPEHPHIVAPGYPTAPPSAAAAVQLAPLVVQHHHHHQQPLQLTHPYGNNNSNNFGSPLSQQKNNNNNNVPCGNGKTPVALAIAPLAMPRTSTASGSAGKATRRGGRKPREAEQQHDPQMTDEDKDRRQKRRERNKAAAARCRRRREEKMQQLQSQVDELRVQNERREQEIRKLREKEERLLELLSARGIVAAPHQFQHAQRIIAATQPHGAAAASIDRLVQASRPSALLAPFVGGNNCRKRGSKNNSASSSESSSASSSARLMAAKKEESASSSADDYSGGDASSTGTDESPTAPPSHGNRFPSRGPLLNRTDPVISESALPLQPPPASFEPSTTTIVAVGAKRPKFEPPFDSSPNHRPNSLQLNTLYSAGFVANTPSKELLGGGALPGGSGTGMTPGSELITPGLSQLSQLAESGSFGVLMAQQTGLTPCQHGPVLIQQGGERPPPSGELSELR